MDSGSEAYRNDGVSCPNECLLNTESGRSAGSDDSHLATQNGRFYLLLKIAKRVGWILRHEIVKVRQLID